MLIPLPNLDDRRWADLVDEGRGLIPYYAPEWTDFNAHDPGITLVELYAWLAEQQIYRLNRVPEAFLRKFLALVDVTPAGPAAARAFVTLSLAPGAPVALPQGTQMAVTNPDGVDVAFSTRHEATVVAGAISSLVFLGATGSVDLTRRLSLGQPLPLFGADPRPGDTLQIGLSESPPAGTPFTLGFCFGGDRHGHPERVRLVEEQRARQQDCVPPDAGCGPLPADGPVPDVSALVHQSVHLAWEVATSAGWVPVGDAVDGTRSLTLSGTVALTLDSAIPPLTLPASPAPLHYLRCRIVRGAFDRAPAAQGVWLNGLEVVQEAPLVSRLTLAADCAVTGAPPAPGQDTSFVLTINPAGEVAAIGFGDADAEAPRVRVLEYSNPPETPGHLTLEAALVGTGDGYPDAQFPVPGAPLVGGDARVSTCQDNAWQRWTLTADFDASGRGDSSVVLDLQSGVLTFGNGERGRALPAGAAAFVVARSTRAFAGNLPAHSPVALAPSAHNAAVAPGLTAEAGRLTLDFPVAAAGGADAESTDGAAGRAIAQRDTPTRAVTLADLEAIARETPGVVLARTGAIAGVHPALPGVTTPGVVTLIVLPFLPAGQPMPSAGTLARVSDYVGRRRILGTRIAVIGPAYRTVTVTVQVGAVRGSASAALAARVAGALTAFFDPLTGGSEGTGWPFGRDVYQAEVMQVVAGVAGVDHVASLALQAGDGPPQCGNVCIGAFGLVASGRHVVEVA